MTTEEMKLLPDGALVRSIKTRAVFQKVPMAFRDVYRCHFKKVGAKGQLIGKVTAFHGARIEPVSPPKEVGK